jgi:7-carboxy-7-deazaguanine synthase
VNSQENLRVTEIFHSIQGESTWAGLPCTFIRLTGCPLRCAWCDTEYSFHGGEKLPLSAILQRIRDIGCELVEITGGEPLIQRNAFRLADGLLDRGHTVLVETSGAVDVSPLDPRVHKIMDLKCPGSGEVDANLWSNLGHLTGRDELKFVLAHRADFDWACQVIRQQELHHAVREGRLGALLFSPVWGALDLKTLSEWVLATDFPVRVQVQLHKLIWDPQARGV